ncbi:MAG: dihydropteroate synthase [Chitinophagaceae bacterium]
MYTLNCGGKLLRLDKPVVMGIINVTPDSFFAHSRAEQTDQVLRQAERMIAEGAVILDLGGQSTRPGSVRVGPADELKRVLPAIEAVQQRFPEMILSVDSYHSLVVEAAAATGVGIVNDISAGLLDPELLPTVARLQLPYVAMHMKGTLQDMQNSPTYTHVTQEVLDFFIEFSGRLKTLGIHEWIVDPGFGFGKTIDHNFQLIRELEMFSMLQRPLLMGISRKSTIYKTLNTTAEHALNGTTVLHSIGLMKGANILRVHDVKEACEAIELVNRIENAGR